MAVQQVSLNILKRPLHFAFRLGTVRPAGPWLKTVVWGEGQKARVVDRLVTVVTGHHDLHVVVQTGAGQTLQVIEGANVFADLQQEAVQATTELVIARRPDVIIELRAEPLPRGQEAKERAVWNSLASVPAVRNNRVHLVTDRRTVIPGPRVAEGVEVMFRVLHRK